MSDNAQIGERRFVRMKETNDHEGETWYWYLPLKGNEKNLRALLAIIREYSNVDEYELDLNNTLSESEVDTLVKHGNDTTMYQNQFNKVTGTMKKPEVDTLVHRFGDYDGQPGWLELDGLYKGGVASLFED
jgi:hypothetical protein